MGLPCCGKESASNAGNTDVGVIPGSGRSPIGGHGNPLQYSCLENPMDRETWSAYKELDTTEVTEHTVTAQCVYINPELPVYPFLPNLPLVTKSLFTMPVSLFLFCKYVHFL